MRRVRIEVLCDACATSIDEEVEGANSVTLTIRGGQWEMDLCDACLGGGFFQEARRKTDEFACDCGKSFATQRGLSHHRTRMHG